MDIVRLDLNIRNTLLILFFLLLILLLYKIRTLLTPFAIAFFLAYLLEPLIDKAEHWKIPRSISILILFVVLSMIITVILLIIIPLAYSEVSVLFASLPDYIDKIIAIIKRFLTKFELQFSFEQVKNIIMDKGAELSKFSYITFGKIGSSVQSIIKNIITLALIPILLFYFSKDFKNIKVRLLNIIKQKTEKDISEYVDEFNQILTRYFRGQFLVALILGILYTIVLMITGVSPAIVVGLTSGLLSIVPYLGFVVGFASSLLLAYLQFSDIWHPFGIIAGFMIVQFLESYFITPKLVGSTLGLHPTVVIFALITGGYLMGLAGMILSLPVAAIIKIWFVRLLDNNNCSEAK